MLNLTDHFLVAMPNIKDKIFSNSVVYVTSYSMYDGTVGVIVNKPLDKKLKNAFKGVNFADYHPKWSNNLLYLGGPVNSSNGFVLHRNTDTLVKSSLFELTNDRSILEKIATSANKDDLFVSIGYSLWNQAQLETEIVKNDWLVVKANPELIYEVEASQRYDEALRMLGVSNRSFIHASEAIFA
jgi:putative transcriptional regulator